MPPTAVPATPTVVTPPAVLDSPFKIKYGQQIEMTSEQLKVKFLGVSADSRCPQDVACAWSGLATVNLMMQKEGEKANPFSVTIYGSSGAPNGENIAQIDGYSIKITALAPGRNSKIELKPADYVATLVLTKLG